MHTEGWEPFFKRTRAGLSPYSPGLTTKSTEKGLQPPECLPTCPLVPEIPSMANLILCSVMGYQRFPQSRKGTLWQTGVLANGMMPASNRGREQKESAVGAKDQAFTFSCDQHRDTSCPPAFCSPAACHQRRGFDFRCWTQTIQPSLKTISLIEVKSVSIHLLGRSGLDFGYILESVSSF